MDYLAPIIDYFGKDWLNQQWDSFRQSKLNDNPDKINANNIKIELELHPLIYEGANYQDIYSPNFDLYKIPHDATYKILCHFGRDLLLLQNELAARGNTIKNPLRNWKEFNNHRFMLLVASGYKLLGYKVEFLPPIKINGKKTADLKVSKVSTEYLIECKQKNQGEEDNYRHPAAARIAENLNEFYLSKRIQGLTVAIDSYDVLEKFEVELIKLIKIHILANVFKKEPVIFEINGCKVEVSFFYTSTKLDLLNILEEERNIKKIAHITRTEDAFVVVDSKNTNLLLLNKKRKEDEIPLDPLVNANLKEKGGNKLIAYYDMGRSYESWTDTIAERIWNDLNDGKYTFENIDCLFTSQTLPLYKNKQVIYQPNMRCVGRISKIGGNPKDLNLLGFQGDTGMDTYFVDL